MSKETLTKQQIAEKIQTSLRKLISVAHSAVYDEINSENTLEALDSATQVKDELYWHVLDVRDLVDEADRCPR